MKPTLIAASAALGFWVCALGPNLASAEDNQPPTRADRMRHMAEDRRIMLDAKLAGMKAGLQLTPDQEKLWAPFESAVKDAETARVLALQKEQDTHLSPMDRNAAKADRLAQSQANLDKIVEAAKPLYLSLDKTQKHKFVRLGRMLVPERGQFAKEIRHLGVAQGD